MWSDNQTTFKKANKDITWLFETKFVSRMEEDLLVTPSKKDGYKRNEMEIHYRTKSTSWLGTTTTSRFLYRQNVLNRFWTERWLAEYLPKLAVRQKWWSEKSPIKEGDVVLISEDNVKRGKLAAWTGRKSPQGSDNLIRTVTLKTKSGIRITPVQKLYLLEEAQTKEPATVEETTSQSEPSQSSTNDAKREDFCLVNHEDVGQASRRWY
ncbi:Hypothetical predicted protein [Paramuricea clavata]|uniref:Uncharacterized protein n=1 Tax=Paramuricea clavata TaxID=317549 RepID=A0A6S7G6F4_PARCT|nr:Hypothetical predicted protein [Paramuricea clavata]